MQDTQERMKEFQKEYREAQLSQDEKRIKKLDVKRDRMMKEQLQLSQQQFKPMAYILLLTVPIFFWLLFRLATDTSSIAMPFFGASYIGCRSSRPHPGMDALVHVLFTGDQPGD